MTCESVPPASFPVLHVIDGKGQPVLSGFLFDIGRQTGCVVAAVVDHVNPVGGQARLVLRQHLGGGASGCQHQQEDQDRQARFAHRMQI